MVFFLFLFFNTGISNLITEGFKLSSLGQSSLPDESFYPFYNNYLFSFNLLINFYFHYFLLMFYFYYIKLISFIFYIDYISKYWIKFRHKSLPICIKFPVEKCLFANYPKSHPQKEDYKVKIFGIFNYLNKVILDVLYLDF